ncbi:hypothetical protein Y032_0661g1282 [Ancylostoma ceylanicum]|uniref:Uncharacterized protein n=1 Tax=Ancylostoma ceylanicum TaxID=53326 RepID=A0A016WK02_9BILA|nr:hypothetical protein Y032_0661g1282 [Ancylostoma ceylanicum]
MPRLLLLPTVDLHIASEVVRHLHRTHQKGGSWKVVFCNIISFTYGCSASRERSIEPLLLIAGLAYSSVGDTGGESTLPHEWVAEFSEKN